ncbi:MAG: DUF167 domain-containing protein [Acidobacteria bacterium]|nr:DUF167 domain-containing protein [Acidobacteriota bacterium]
MNSLSPPGVVISVRVQPRASRDRIMLQADGSWKVALTAPPVGDAANRALVDLLAAWLHVSRGSVQIVSGRSARNKRLRISGIGPEQLRERLKAAQLTTDD